MLSLKVMTARVTKVHSEVVVLGAFHEISPPRGLAGEVDWIHQGVLSRLILQEKFTGKIGDALLIHTHLKLSTPIILLLGLGPRENFNFEALQNISRTAIEKVSHLNIKQCAIEVFGLLDGGLDLEKSIDGVWGAFLGAPNSKEMDLSLLVPDEKKARQIEQRLMALGGSV